MERTTKIGMMGCGNISSIYLENIKRFRNIETIAVADLILERSKGQAEKYGVPKVLTPEQLLADPDVEIVLNLTVPVAHGDVAIAALEAGKHVYNEKPLAVSRESARKALDIANRKNLRVGCAPDTFMGASLQSCRKLIDDGAIGEPVAVTGFMLGSGPENWHPDPEFFYKPGGGPMLDMGPYYITTMISLIGGIKSVSGSARATFAERTVGSGAKKGTKFTVETPTYISGTLNFTGGAIGNLVTSFDCWGHKHTNMEIYGTEGSMIVPDPNNFTGAIQIMKAHGKEWIDEPLTHSFAENSRGVGVADMAAAIQENRPHRASGAQAYHVLDVMLGILDAAKSKTTIELNSAVERPEALPVGLPEDSVR